MSARLVFFSDFVCPFCYVAERGVLTRLLDEFDLEFQWNGFELHPGTPKGGMAVAELFKGRSVEAMHDQMRKFAASFGVTIRMADHMANTRRAHAMATFARDHGKLEAFRDAAMEAYWDRGANLEDDGELRAIATTAGLDPASALEAADSPALQARVDALGDEARRWGVTGIPTYFLLPDGWEPGMPAPASGALPVKIVGCQPYETVLAGCMRAQVARRPPD